MDNQSSFLGTEEQPADLPTSDEKTMAILSHILTLVCGFIAPLIIFIIKKDESKFVSDHARESLNFQITLFIGYVIGIITTIILIGVFILIFLGIAHLILVIVATIRASEGKIYRYPFNLRLIK
jgi:uncharacterized Tic20 family protein